MRFPTSWDRVSVLQCLTLSYHFKRVVFFSISCIIITVIPQTCAQRQDGPMQNVKGAEYHETLTDIESFLYLSFVIIYLFVYFLMP